MRTLLKSHISRVKVTACKPDYEGSCTIDKDLMIEKNIREDEQVIITVDDINREGAVTKEDLNRIGKQFWTYAIDGKKGEICCNGAFATCMKVGDVITIDAYEVK
jgi:aspartate 1-decarboxylase